MSLSSRTVRVAVVQACTSAYDLDKTIQKLGQYTREARDQGAQLAVFPEAFVGGYPKMSTFGTVIGSRSDEGREEFLRYHSSAIEVPSEAISRIEEISRETGVFLVVGVIEKAGGTLYCTVVFIDPQDGFVAKHRKLLPTASERIIWGMGDGSTLPVLSRSFRNNVNSSDVVKAKLSATICWENYMPLLRYQYYQLGTEIYCAPTVDARPVWQHTMRHIALEGRCFVLSACQFSKEKDYPDNHAVAVATARDPENVMIAGGSVIVSPLGKVLAGPLLGKEGLLVADIDLNDIIRGKFDLDVAGHYSRPDVFKFHCNTEVQG